MNFRLPLLAAAVAALAFGCARDDQRVGAEATPSMTAPATATAAQLARGAMGAGATALDRFASLPDRGALVAYPSVPVVRVDGAYTWHFAQVSEQHARDAIGGVLSVPLPNGEQLRFRYQRHVEHSSGDWTWVGDSIDAPGQQALLTFGEKATYGSLGQAGKQPWRVTTRGGAAWLVETDSRKLALIDNEATRPTRPDFFVPPNREVGGPRKAGAPAAMSATAASVGTAATSTIDLVIGYTAGFATAQGSTSAAVTRLNSMVETTNQAYVNSGVSARVRLVKTLQVSYTDSNSNDTALEELTGFQAPSTQTTPNAAFNALRAARDQYGADLVSLVRPFREPEHGGCGIAWLIGGGQDTIRTSDEFFGYSVVSDGEDRGTDGNTYYCREETLAHELGHNMGSAHDVATSRGDDGVLQANEYGAFPYSFGYKTAAGTGNFYTVMAYGDSGQTSYRTFSNPRTTFCGGRACGVTDQADNARSLTQTIPTVVQFRATVVPEAHLRVEYDFDGDGRSDVLWRNQSTGANVVWYDASSSTAATLQGVAAPWNIVAVGDFAGDGVSDIVWRNDSTGANILWRDGAYASRTGLPSFASPWRVVGAGDFDGDGKDDLLWRNPVTGANEVWPAATQSLHRALGSASGSTWTAPAIADFNGDGKDDVFWRRPDTGVNTIWLSADINTRSSVQTIIAPWALIATGDFNGDGKADVFWRNSSSGYNVVWYSANYATRAALPAMATSWTVPVAADYDGDGKADLFWRNGSAGTNVIWRSAVSTTTMSVASLAGSDWVPVH